MRIVFMGTPEFAVASLEALITEGHDIAAVVTASDKPGGRGRKEPLTSAVATYARKHALPLLQPEKLRDEHFLDALNKLQADLFVVVAFRMLPEVVWAMPPKGTINLHGSLLPAYRGAAPIHWAILNGEQETGVSLFFLKQQIDTGDIIHQEHIPIGPKETTGQLHDRMMHIGARALVRTVSWIVHHEIHPRQQTDALASHAPKIFTETARLDFNWSNKKLFDWVRGMNPYPAAWFNFQGKKIKIFNIHSHEGSHTEKPGSISFINRQMRIASAEGWIEILEIQPEGRQRMPIRDFLNGMNWKEGFIGVVDPLEDQTPNADLSH